MPSKCHDVWGKRRSISVLPSKKMVQIKETVICQLPLAIKTSITGTDRLKLFLLLLFLFTMLCLDLVHQLLYKNVWYAYIRLTGFGRKLKWVFFSWRRLTKRQCVSRLWIAVNYSACAYLRLNRKKWGLTEAEMEEKREPRRWYLGAADPEAADPLPSSGRQEKSSLEKAWESRNQTVRGEREITGFNSTPCSHQFSLNSQPILHACTDLRL